MFLSSPFSQPSLLTSTQNQPLKSPRSLSIASAKMASPPFPFATSLSNPPSPTLAKPSSFYEVLGIPMGATLEQIKSAYRKLARVCHPDVAPKESPVDEFMKIQTAYSTLSDPEKRVDYDLRILRTDRRFTTIRTSSASPAPVYSRRKWETDQCW